MRLFFSNSGRYTDKDNTSFIVRPYRRSDRSDVLQITRETFDDVSLEAIIEKHFGEINDTDWAERKCSGIDSDLTYYAKSTFVAEFEHRVVAFVTTRLYHKYRIGHIANLAVKVEFQGRGIGRALVEHSLRFFRDAGMQHARIETMDNNEKGQKFYPSMGFKEIGRQIFYFRDL